MRMLTAVVVRVAAPLSARAEVPDVVPDDLEIKIDKDEEKKEEDMGWKYAATLGATASLNSVRNVIGTVDGETYNLGAQLKATANYSSGQSDRENTLTADITQTRTPALPVFIKSAAELRLSSTYLYRIEDWWGPYAQGEFTTAMARGFDVRNDAVEIERIFRDGTRSGPLLKGEQETFKLTGPYEPITLSESIGGFLNASDTAKLKARFKLGVGGEQVLVRDGFIFTGEDGTYDEGLTRLLYTQLQSSSQLGAVLRGSFDGTLAENVTYSVNAKVFYAAVSDFEFPDGSELEGSDLLSTEIDA